jgi:hypothetical protein
MTAGQTPAQVHINININIISGGALHSCPGRMGFMNHREDFLLESAAARNLAVHKTSLWIFGTYKCY